jgi:hypothetical protein
VCRSLGWPFGARSATNDDETSLASRHTECAYYFDDVYGTQSGALIALENTSILELSVSAIELQFTTLDEPYAT